MNIVRAFLMGVAGTIQRIYTAKGRVDETVEGKMYQHYGFRSLPPAGVELVHVEQGNLGVSVAENDGDLGASFAPGRLESQVTGDVLLYTLHGHYIALTNSNDFKGIMIDASLANVGIRGRDVGLESGPGDIGLNATTGDINIRGHAVTITSGTGTGTCTIDVGAIGVVRITAGLLPVIPPQPVATAAFVTAVLAALPAMPPSPTYLTRNFVSS